MKMSCQHYNVRSSWQEHYLLLLFDTLSHPASLLSPNILLLHYKAELLSYCCSPLLNSHMYIHAPPSIAPAAPSQLIAVCIDKLRKGVLKLALRGEVQPVSICAAAKAVWHSVQTPRRSRRRRGC